MNVSSYLYAPESYRKALPEVVAKVVNGCGPSGWKIDIVPDTIYWLPIGEECGIHDWEYEAGETEADKELADFHLLHNLLAHIDCASSQSITGKILKPLRCQRAFEYYMAVKEFGHHAFWAGKGHHA